MRILSSLLSILLISVMTYGQGERCGSVTALDRLIQEEPGIEYRMQEMEKAVEAYLENKENLRSSGDVIYIPVVVHVVWKIDVQNISDEQVLSQIDVLNEDFRRFNLDASNTRSDFSAIAADTRIEFCLADTDPDGNPTNGIQRVETLVSQFKSSDSPHGWDNVKRSEEGGSDAWNKNEYLNLWVCNLEPSSGVLGYAYPPNTVQPWRDGVVIHYRYFGRVGVLNPPYNLGRTTTHEVGHWLGLKHIWGDGGCGVNDLPLDLDDTPDSNTPNYGCPAATVQHCGTLDMWENYMDYTNDACMNTFTQGQADYMYSILETSRSTIPASPKCYLNTGIADQAIDISDDVFAYPNPTSGPLYVGTNLDYDETLSVVIHNLIGQRIGKQEYLNRSSALTLNLGDLSPGVYFLQVYSDNFRGMKKILLNK